MKKQLDLVFSGNYTHTHKNKNSLENVSKISKVGAWRGKILSNLSTDFESITFFINCLNTIFCFNMFVFYAKIEVLFVTLVS